MRFFSRHPIKIILAATLLILLIFAPTALRLLGHQLILNTAPLKKADAAVVLSTGIGYSPRLKQAALLHSSGTVKQVVINGNRKTDFIRALEKQGFKAPSPWYENPVAMLTFFGVPREEVIIINAEDAYDTISEAEITGPQLIASQVNSIIVTTSKFHTRRAHHIWQQRFANQLDIQVTGAREDPFDPDNWWKNGRQIRQLLAEYGAWFFYWGKQSPL